VIAERSDMDHELERTMFIALYGIVVLEAMLSAISLASLLAVAVLRGFRRRFLMYVYEIALLTLYLHYLWGRAPHMTEALPNLAYWASLLGLAPLTALPIFLEWKEINEAMPSRRTVASRERCAIVFALMSLLVTAFLAMILKFMILGPLA
jgi:hypothetical protein